jgi:glycosyltransferase involved in cell wall biosynthesis
MSVTVLLPVHNGSQTLRQAVDSILNQDETDFELLIVDDASTDDSLAIAHGYSRRDSRVTVVARGRSSGLASALNEGLIRASHEFVARMDADDQSLPSRLRIQREFLDTSPAVVAVGSAVLHMGARRDFDHLVEPPQTPREIARTLQTENCIYHSSVMMRRTAVLDLGGYRTEFLHAEDYDLWLRLSRNYDLVNLPEPLLRYRVSVGGMTLARPWRQLYFVYLAQALHQDASISLDEGSARAQEMLAEMNRKWFLSQVAKGTVTELARLRRWRDALGLSARFIAEIGPVASARLTGLVAREYARTRRES